MERLCDFFMMIVLPAALGFLLFWGIVAVIEKERCECHYRTQSQIAESHSGPHRSLSPFSKGMRAPKLSEPAPLVGLERTRSF